MRFYNLHSKTIIWTIKQIYNFEYNFTVSSVESVDIISITKYTLMEYYVSADNIPICQYTTTIDKYFNISTG